MLRCVVLCCIALCCVVLYGIVALGPLLNTTDKKRGHALIIETLLEFPNLENDDCEVPLSSSPSAYLYDLTSVTGGRGPRGNLNILGY